MRVEAKEGQGVLCKVHGKHCASSLSPDELKNDTARQRKNRGAPGSIPRPRPRQRGRQPLGWLGFVDRRKEGG